ncbi:MAG TPA: pyridoxal-dependent decarboxylase [Bacteroidota bacterium]|nr:pyridoxal-dependent decarboxylase [Bacteroidota bacterium]
MTFPTKTTPLSIQQQLDLSSEEFRRYAHEFVSWIANYLDHPERYKVFPDVKPGDIKSKLPSTPPEHPEPLDAVIKDIDRIIAPGLTHWNHPGFMAYFGISSSKPAILGELVSAAFDTNAMLWKTGPAAVELEEVVLDWLRQLLGLPDGYYGLIHDTASVSSLVALAAAREALNLHIREEGMSGRHELPKLRIYTSEHAHSSIEKAAIVLGLGQKGLRKIEVDAEFRMRVDRLREAIEHDINAGIKPCAVVATVGTTSTTSIDPVREIAEVCQKHDLWLHVDAAYAGNAALLPEMRWLVDGCDQADSLVFNPHKWLFVPIDCSVLYCRKPDILRQAFSLVPEYLRTGEEEVRNPMDYGISLGRRFRALKLWMVLRTFGVTGIRERLRYHIALAKKFRSWVEEHPDFEVVAPTPLSVVCFRYRPQNFNLSDEDFDTLNEKLLEAVNKSGEVFLSHTKLHDRYTLRLAIGNLGTTEQHVRRAWELLLEQANIVMHR